MTIADDLGRKATKQNLNSVSFEIVIYISWQNSM